MPNETRQYVPKLQAVKNIIAAPDRFRVELPVIENHPYFQAVNITRDIDVKLAAQMAEISVEDFRELNPSAHRPFILAAGTPQILLPWDNAQVFRRNFDDYSTGQLASWTAWTAPATMTVASAAQRLGMREDELRSINGIPPHMAIRAGSTLVVRRSAQRANDVSDHVADNAQLALAPETVTVRSTVRAGKRDTVASIARRFDLSAAQVADWNDVSTGAKFKPGHAVVIYRTVRNPALGPVASARSESRTEERRSDGKSKRAVAAATAAASTKAIATASTGRKTTVAASKSNGHSKR